MPSTALTCAHIYPRAALDLRDLQSFFLAAHALVTCALCLFCLYRIFKDLFI
jgi:hypothetical protein